MATASVAGYKGVFAASTAAPAGTVTKLGEVRNFELTMDHAPIDATSHDSSGDKEVIAGVGSWNGSAEFLHVQADTEQQEAHDVLAGRTKVDFEFYPTGSSGDGYYHGDGFFTGWSLASPNEDAAAVNVGFEGTGALARA